MDTVPLVEQQVEDGQRLLDRLSQENVPIRAACWAKSADEDRWSLYIATPLVDEKGPLAAYREVYRVLRSLPDVWVTDSDIKLIGEKHPIAREVLDLLRHFPDRTPTRSRRPLLGGIALEEVYVYPLRKSTPVEVPIHGLVFHGEPSGALHLSFEPHNRHSTLVVEGKEYAAETGIDWVVAAPEGARLERTGSGQPVLVWDRNGNRMRSSANEVWSLAKLGLQGFRFLSESAKSSDEPPAESTSSPPASVE